MTLCYGNVERGGKKRRERSETGLVRERREERRPNIPTVVSTGTEVTGAVSPRTPGMVEEHFIWWVREGQGGNKHPLLFCWGRREGCRNNLDGLGLMKREKKQTKRQTQPYD